MKHIIKKLWYVVMDEGGPNKLSERIGNEDVREEIRMMMEALKNAPRTHHEKGKTCEAGNRGKVTRKKM